MNLADLRARWISASSRKNGGKAAWGKRPPDSIGLLFLCPVCWLRNNGPVRTHGVIIPEVGAPPELMPNHARWRISGDLAHLATLHGSVGGMNWPCRAHFTVVNGEIGIL